MTDDVATEVTNKHQEVATLSKSWKKQTVHSTIYNGGKVVICQGEGLNTGLEDSSSKIQFLAAMYNGDVALIDASRGVKLSTIRKGLDFEDEMPENEQLGGGDLDDIVNESVLSDPDAIVCFALGANELELVTASRSGILRHYDIRNALIAESEGGGIKLKRTIGRAHKLPIRCMEFYPADMLKGSMLSTFLATGSVDGQVKVWDIHRGYATHAFNFSKGISCLRWKVPSPTDNVQHFSLILAAGCDDGVLRVFDLNDRSNTNKENGKVSTSVLLDTKDHSNAPVTCICWPTVSGTRATSTDLLMTAGRDEVLHVYEKSSEIDTLLASKRRKSSSGKGTKIPKTGTYNRIKTLPMYEQIEGLQVIDSETNTSDGEVQFLTLGSKGLIHKYLMTMKHSTASIDLQLVLSQPAKYVFGSERGGYLHIVPLPKKSHFIAIDAEHNLSFIHSETLETERVMIGENDEIIDLKYISSVNDDRSSPNAASSPRIVVATNSSQVRIFNATNFSCEAVLSGVHTEIVLSVDVSPCGRFIATCGKDKTMHIWCANTARCLASAIGHTEAIGGVSLSRKRGKYSTSNSAFAVTCAKDKTLKRWYLPSSLELLKETDDKISLTVASSALAHEKDINIVSVSPNDAFIVTGSQDKTAKIWHSNTLELKGTLRGHKRGVWDCQFSPYDRVVATCSGDQTIKLWSLADCSCVRTFQGHTASVLRVRFLSGGLQLISSGADGLIKLWTIRSLECEATMDAHLDRVWALDIAENEKEVVSGGADSRMVVWTDNTLEIEREKREAEETNVLMEQKLANHLRNKEFDQALEMVLALDKPRQALKVITALIEHDLQNGEDSCLSLKSHVGQWKDDKIAQILRYAREWNTWARNSQVAMAVVRAVTSTVSVPQLAGINETPEVVAGIIPYAERHFDRLDKLISNSYLIDYTLSCMGNILEEEENVDWEANSTLVLPPKAVLEKRKQINRISDSDVTKESDDEVLTVGDSDSSDEELQ